MRMAISPRLAIRTRLNKANSLSAAVAVVEQWYCEGALAQEFKRLVAVERMVQSGAHVAEQALERQPFEI